MSMDDSVKERTCFVVGPVGSEGSETRRHADQLLKYIIEPAAREADVPNIIRSDKIESSGMITSDIISHLHNADMVVADLSFGNPNAFYELAIRHMLRKPFVHVVRDDDDIPFDVGQNRTVTFNLHDLDIASKAKQELASFIRSEISKSGEEIMTPFTLSLDIDLLRRKPSNSASDLDALGRVVADMSKSIARLEHKLDRGGASWINLETYQPLGVRDARLATYAPSVVVSRANDEMMDPRDNRARDIRLQRAHPEDAEKQDHLGGEEG